MRHALLAILLVGFITILPRTLWAAEKSSTAADWSAAGPFPVGVTTVVLVESNRTDAFTKERRTLVTEIWYPAADEARNSAKNKFSDFIPATITPEIEQVVHSTYKMSVSEVDKAFWNESVRNAPVRDGKYPLITLQISGEGETK